MNANFISDFKPFRMYGNIYFVGSAKYSVHLIDTEVGLVLIDTGVPAMYEQILDSIQYLGFDPKDICAIIHSHAHIDHFGCTHKFKELSGATTYISRIDNDLLKNKTLSGAYRAENESLIRDCDVLIEDGDVLRFGSTSIRFRLAPGHTDGTLAIFITVPDGENSIIAAMHGGTGINTLTKEYITANGRPFSIRDDFRSALHSLRDEHVDLVLGNHPYHTATAEKLEKVMAGQSILDSDEWREYLIATEKKLDTLIENESKNTDY